MNIFVIAGGVFLIGSIVWYVWLTNREGKALPRPETPPAEPSSQAGPDEPKA
jgi:hypothetical protein